MTYPVFIQQDQNLDYAKVGEALTVTGQEAHHATTVMRLKTGDIADLVDGMGLRVRVEITAVSKPSFECVVLEKTFTDTPRPQLHLIQALAKGGRDEQAVESCTELSISSVQPWSATRCVSIWSGAKVAKGIAKWQNIVKAATKQSRQSRLPEVKELVDSKTLAQFIRENSSEKVAFIVLHESASQYLVSQADNYFENLDHIYLIVGPEGGISDIELQAFENCGAKLYKLTDSVLRTSNAGATAVTMIATKAKLWSK